MTPGTGGDSGAFPALERRVGKYRLLDLVGRGAMGQVYAAVDDHTGRKVAIKVVNTDLEGEPDIRVRFFREAQTAARLVHRNVITIYDLGEDYGSPFIVMELLRGWTLASYLNEAPAAELERKVDLMIQLCDGMAAAHAANIIHRDLKPGNLFVQFDGLLKVLDFGVARLASSNMTTTGAQPGTLHYMSPEQARGEEVDQRSDIFSAGSVFYFMLTGRKPFPGDEWARVIRKLQSEDPQALGSADAPPELASIVMRCLAKLPADRYHDFPSVAADLTKFQRQYQADTRRLLETVGSRYNALLTSLTSVVEAARRVGHEIVATSPVLERLHGDFPTLRDRGFDAMKLAPLTRARVVALQDEIGRELQRVQQQQRGLDQLASLLTTGEQALSEGRYPAAARVFEHILTALPESSTARARLAECRAILDQQQADAQRVKSLVREAQAHLRSEEWERVIVVCDDILRIDRTVPLAIALHQAARTALDRQRAAEFEREQAVQRAVQMARASFMRGRYDEALEALRAFLVMQPEAADVQIELNRLSDLAVRRADEAAARDAEVQQRTEAVRAMLDAGAVDAALTEAQLALQRDPANESTAMLLCQAIELESAARIAGQRDGAAHLALEAARVAFGDGDLLRAIAAAENAVRLSPSLSEASELLERTRATLASDASDGRLEEEESGAGHASAG
jgi:eukaryotic-like serine/threonine-protein kinase